MRTSQLLLLFVLSVGASADDINWKECGDTAFCQVHPICNNDQSSGYLQPFIVKANTCKIGFHIKPESFTKWSFSMVYEDGDASLMTPKRLIWKIGTQDVFKCIGNNVELDAGISGISISNVKAYATENKFFCIFTVNAQNGHSKISKILDSILDSSSFPMSTLSGPKNFFADLNPYSRVDSQIQCKKDDLFPTCDDKPVEEECVEAERNWDCPASLGYSSLFRKDKTREFIEANVNCIKGQFIVMAGTEALDLSSDSEAKCARKKCSRCRPRDDFKNVKDLEFQKADGFDQCAILNCTKGFMVINGKIPVTSTTVQCSHKNVVKQDTEYGDIKGEDARWIVEDKDDFDIVSVECREAVECEKFNKIETATACAPNEQNCHTVSRNATGQFECKTGQMYLKQGDKFLKIDPPSCDASSGTGKWNVTIHHGTSSTAPETKEWDQAPPLIVKCIVDPVSTKVAAAQTSFEYTWVIILLIVILLIIIAIAIGAYCYLDRKKKKKAAAAALTKTSTTTSKTSSKPGSSEQEPLTSAMKSITGESLQTARATNPTIPTVVLNKADLRKTTAASSDTSTKKEEEKTAEPGSPEKKETKKKKEESVKRREEQKDPSTNFPTDDTSKKVDDSAPASKKEKFAPFPTSNEDPLKSQTGGDGESQVEKIGESTKLLPGKRGPPKKYSKSSGASGAKKQPNNDFLNVTDSEEELSKTGSKKPGKKRM